MTIEAIKDKVFEILGDMCTESISDTSATLQGDLSLDSLNMVMLLVMIEDVFEIVHEFMHYLNSSVIGSFLPEYCS